MNLLLAFVVGLGNLAGALIAPRDRRGPRSILAVMLGACAVFAPLWIPANWPIFRTVAAFGLMAGFFRVISIALRPRSSTLGRVLAVTLPVVEPRRVDRIPSVMRIDLFIAGIFEIACAVFLFVCVKHLPRAIPYAGMPSAMRTLVGGASAYFVVDGTARLLEALSRAIGLDLGPLHDAPILARTVGEFWSRRWNRAVHAWMNEFVFRPTTKRFGAAIGVLATFGVSAILHFVPITMAYDVRWAIPMGAFFLLHGVIVVIEAKLGVSRWPRALGHAWTLSMFALTAPLFVEPLLQSLGA